MAGVALRPARTAFHGLFSRLIFPDNCRCCAKPLQKLTRIPVCQECLDLAACPIEAEYQCARCRAPFLNPETLNDDGICPACHAEPEGLDYAWSYGSYDGTLRRLIHVYKYERVDTLAGPLARLLIDALPRDEQFDLIAPMPLHWRKQWDRGFNQADLLAREVADWTGIPYEGRLLRRVKASPAQAGLSFAARQSNVKGVFRVRRNSVPGKHVLLIDDVLTTGATAASAARLLRRTGGASRVSILTLARADRRFAWKVGPEPIYTKKRAARAAGA
ncbi:competence protein ComF [Bryobacterales bacterium F-183]|nr:competence protein ComF [Bryobacterales bacterium F-183]